MKLQLVKFCCIGTLAAAVHMTVVAILVSFSLHPLLANVFGFTIAFNVSYFGHRLWTFHHDNLPGHATAAVRFWAVAVFSFIANEGLFFIFLNYTTLPYLVSLFLVLLMVTPLTFLFSRSWAFGRQLSD